MVRLDFKICFVILACIFGPLNWSNRAYDQKRLLAQCGKAFKKQELLAPLKSEKGKKATIRKLEDLLDSLHPGTAQYTSVAFELALSGHRTEMNVQHMLFAWNPPSSTGENDLRSEGYPDDLRSFQLAIRKLYAKYPSNKIIWLILHSEADGAASVVQEELIGYLFFKSPRTVLSKAMTDKEVVDSVSIVNHDNAVERLANALARAGAGRLTKYSRDSIRADHTRARVTLRSLMEEGGARIQEGAKRCLNLFEKQVKALFH